MARVKSNRLVAAIPKKYTPDFMQRLDPESVIGKAVSDQYHAVLADLGGEEVLTTAKHSLVRRFVWLDAMISGIEYRVGAGEKVDIGSWTQLTNTWLGIARLLGLERKQRPVKRLRDHLQQDAAA